METRYIGLSLLLQPCQKIPKALYNLFVFCLTSNISCLGMLQKQQRHAHLFDEVTTDMPDFF
jgi:hypothetical protein